MARSDPECLSQVAPESFVLPQGVSRAPALVEGAHVKLDEALTARVGATPPNELRQHLTTTFQLQPCCQQVFHSSEPQLLQVGAQALP